MYRSALDKGNTSKPCVTSRAKGRKVQSSSKLLSLAGAVGLAAAAAMTPNDAEAAWIDDGCTTPSIGAIWEVAGDPDSDDHLFTAQSDELVYLKDSGSSSYTAIDSIISTFKTSYSGDSLAPQDIQGDIVLMRNRTQDILFSVSLAELRTGTIGSLTEYNGNSGGYASVSNGRIFAVTSSDHDTIHEFSTGSTPPSALFSDSTGDFLGAVVVDINNTQAYTTDASDEIREYSSISGSVTPTYTGFYFDVSSLIDESIASTGFRTLVGVDYAASSGGDVCVIYNDSYPAPTLTDTDGDGVYDDNDDCPTQDSTGYDTDGDGCIDDIDGDGSLADEDCDDNDASSYPGSDEYCDGIDNDCDDIIDNNPIDGDTWHEDLDGDGAGNPDTEMSACSQPEGYVANGDDCDDLDEERINNCDSVIDLGDGLMVEVSQGDAEDTVSFNEETGVLTLLVAGIQYDIYVGTTAISAEWAEAGATADLGAEARAEIYLGILSNGMLSPTPPNESDDLAQCEDGIQYGPVDTADQSKWMTVNLVVPGTTKSTVDVKGAIDMYSQALYAGDTVSFADTVECSDEEIPEDTDTDGDGIIDSEDDCPNEFGTKPDGCPEDDTENPDDTGVDDTGDNKTDDPDGGCSSVPTSPGPNALLLAGMLAGIVARRKKKNSQGEASQE